MCQNCKKVPKCVYNVPNIKLNTINVKTIIRNMQFFQKFKKSTKNAKSVNEKRR